MSEKLWALVYGLVVVGMVGFLLLAPVLEEKLIQWDRRRPAHPWNEPQDSPVKTYIGTHIHDGVPCELPIGSGEWCGLRIGHRGDCALGYWEDKDSTNS